MARFGAFIDSNRLTDLIYTDSVNNRIGLMTIVPDVELHMVRTTPSTWRISDSILNIAIDFGTNSSTQGFVGTATNHQLLLRSFARQGIMVGADANFAAALVKVGGGNPTTLPDAVLDVFPVALTAMTAEYITFASGRGTDAGSELTFAAGTVANQRENLFRQTTYVGTGAGSTLTNPTTLHIAGEPLAGANMTLTNPRAFRVASGVSLFEGRVDLGDIAIRVGTSAGFNEFIYDNQAGAGWAETLIRADTASSNNIRVTLIPSGTSVISSLALSNAVSRVNFDLFEIRVDGATVSLQSSASGTPATSIANVDAYDTWRFDTRIQARTATEIAITVTNGTLVVGSAGSMQAPYLAAAQAAGTDGDFGDLNGCFAFLRDTNLSVSTIEARINGVWVSTSLSGYIIQARVPGICEFSWTHPNQHRYEERGAFLDETVCVACGEQLKRYDPVVMWVNQEIPGKGLHSIFGHPHLERDPYIASLERRLEEAERKLALLTPAGR